MVGQTRGSWSFLRLWRFRTCIGRRDCKIVVVHWELLEVWGLMSDHQPCHWCCFHKACHIWSSKKVFWWWSVMKDCWVSHCEQGWENIALHSVQIYDRNIDNIVTLYCLRCASGHLADYIQYTCYIGPLDNIRYVLPLCPINSMTSACIPPSYIQYPMECDRQTMLDINDIKQ